MDKHTKRAVVAIGSLVLGVFCLLLGMSDRSYAESLAYNGPEALVTQVASALMEVTDWVGGGGKVARYIFLGAGAILIFVAISTPLPYEEYKY